MEGLLQGVNAWADGQKRLWFSVKNAQWLHDHGKISIVEKCICQHFGHRRTILLQDREEVLKIKESLICILYLLYDNIDMMLICWSDLVNLFLDAYP